MGGFYGIEIIPESMFLTIYLIKEKEKTPKKAIVFDSVSL